VVNEGVDNINNYLSVFFVVVAKESIWLQSSNNNNNKIMKRINKMINTDELR